MENSIQMTPQEHAAEIKKFCDEGMYDLTQNVSKIMPSFTAIIEGVHRLEAMKCCPASSIVLCTQGVYDLKLELQQLEALLVKMRLA